MLLLTASVSEKRRLQTAAISAAARIYTSSDDVREDAGINYVNKPGGFDPSLNPVQGTPQAARSRWSKTRSNHKQLKRALQR